MAYISEAQRFRYTIYPLTFLLMNTWQIALRRFIPFFFFLILFASAIVFIFYPRKQLNADRVVFRAGELLTISETLGEKQLINDPDIKMVFDRRDGKILFGKGWQDQIPESERVGGTELWLFNEKTGQLSNILKGLNTTDALLTPDGNVLFTNLDAEIFLSSADGLQKKKLGVKGMTPDISLDGKLVVYQKLPNDWTSSPYFEDALGIFILDLTTNTETTVSKKLYDWGAQFTPDGKRILFMSANENGVGAFFTVKIDGTERMQLTNLGQKSFTNESVPLPSEKLIFSPDGKSLVFESDRAIWLLRFNPEMTKITQAKQVSFGIDPQWIIPGKRISVLASPGAQWGRQTITVDLER